MSVPTAINGKRCKKSVPAGNPAAKGTEERSLESFSGGRSSVCRVLLLSIQSVLLLMGHILSDRCIK